MISVIDTLLSKRAQQCRGKMFDSAFLARHGSQHPNDNTHHA
jgi:hypothetical protein